MSILYAGAVIRGGDGGNPSLTRDEANFFVFFVAEDDLGVFRGLFPSTLDDAAVLEDVGVAGADGGDVFVVIIVGSLFFLNNHGDDDGGGELFFGTDEFGGDFAGLTGAVITSVSGAGFVRTPVGVSGDVVIVNGVEVRDGAKAEGKVRDFGRKEGGVAFGGLVDFEAFGDLDVDFVASSGGGFEAGEGFDVGGEVAVIVVETVEIVAGGEEVVPEALDGVVGGGAPHVVVVF